MDMEFNLKKFGELGDRFFGGVSRKSQTYGCLANDEMLQAAIDKGIKNGLLPKAGFCDEVAKNWKRMEECLNAALAKQDNAESEVSE